MVCSGRDISDLTAIIGTIRIHKHSRISFLAFVLSVAERYNQIFVFQEDRSAVHDENKAKDYL